MQSIGRDAECSQAAVASAGDHTRAEFPLKASLFCLRTAGQIPRKRDFGEMP